MLSSYHSHNHWNYCKLLYYRSSHQHQGTEPPSLAQQSGLSTQSCQKTSTNDTKVREKLCDLSLYLSTYRPIQKRLWEGNSSSQVWSGRGGIHPVFTNIEQHRAKVPFFAYSNEYLIINFNINNICIPAAILIYIANQGRRVRRLRRLHVRRRLLTQLGSRQRHPWHSRPGEGSSPSS